MSSNMKKKGTGYFFSSIFNSLCVEALSTYPANPSGNLTGISSVNNRDFLPVVSLYDDRIQILTARLLHG